MGQSTPSSAGYLSLGARVVLVLSCGWMALVVGLWVGTRHPQPTVNVRWKATASARERSSAARDLSLLLDTPRDEGTGTYFVLDASRDTIRRIVLHPLIEDTAFIDRGTFTLRRAPTAPMWAGDRFPIVTRPAIFYLAFVGAVVSGVILLARGD